MRRSSVVAPLLLIGIGALFLFRNMYPELALLDFLAKYWPVLLIIWGGLRLAEILTWAATNRPLPARGISGGEWILVMFLCFFGVTLYTVKGFSTWWPGAHYQFNGIEMFGESFDYPISGEKACSKTPRIVIDSFRGNARIVGADVSVVKVSGHKTVRSLDQNGANEADKATPFELTGDNDVITIRTNQDRMGGDRRATATAEMEISVPKGASIEAHGRRGDFDVIDINGAVEIISDNAGVRLQNLGGDARIDLRNSDIVRAINVKGSLEVKGRGQDVEIQGVEGTTTVTGTYSGVLQFRNLAKALRFHGTNTELSLEKLPGQIRMPLGQFTGNDLVGPVNLSTRSRDVQMTDVTNGLEVSVDRGDIELRPGKLPLSRIDAHTRSGDVELALPGGAKFDLTAGTKRGDVTNDFGAPLRRESDRQGATLRGTVAGGPTVNLQTERGQVLVRKASSDDTPAGTDTTDAKPKDKSVLKRVDQ
jgi:hypothetical protein